MALSSEADGPDAGQESSIRWCQFSTVGSTILETAHLGGGGVVSAVWLCVVCVTLNEAKASKGDVGGDEVPAFGISPVGKEGSW
jgi:hypothetical protein